MRLQLITTFALSITGSVSGKASSSCPGVAAPLYGFATHASFHTIKVAGGLQKPRGIVIDNAGRLLILEREKGISQHTVNSTGCITTSVPLLNLTSLNHGIWLSSNNTRLYASSSTDVFSWAYNPTTGKIAPTATTVVTGMDDVGHTTRTVIIPPNKQNLLVVSHGSNSNIDNQTITPTTARAIVKVFDLSAIPSGGYNYVTQGYNAGYGLRNEVGLAFDGQGMLWGVENSADELTRTINGVTTDIHLNNPAEELNLLGDVSKPNNKWYGYPTCFTVGDPTSFKGSKFSLGDQFVTAPTTAVNDTFCKKNSVPPRLTFPAHSAPLDAKFDAKSRNLWVTFHGAWDRKPPTGFAVVRVPFAKASDGSYAPVAASDKPGLEKILAPKKANAATCTATSCVRPVGLVFDAAGRVYMTSDASGELFMISKV